MPHDAAETPIPCLVGPTGSGKSEVAVALARRIGAEVVCCDALTVYAGLPILTAHPQAPADVPHHLSGFLDPREIYSAARFTDDADRLVEEIRARGRMPLLVGGTALYLKAFAKGLGPRVRRDEDLRARLERLASEDGPASLHARLLAVDPVRAAEVHENDVRRIVRALEIVEATGGPASALRREWHAPDRRPLAIVGIRRSPEDLDRRIAERVDAMVALGVVDEVRAFRLRAETPSREAQSALGLADLGEHIEGRLALAECVERIVRATRRFSKRQATFFRQFPVAWIDATEGVTADGVAARVIESLRASGVAIALDAP